MSPARTTSGAPVSSIGRGIAVLACFTSRAHALTLSELSAASKLPMSSTHRVVAELVNGGFLVRGQDKRYRIGTRLWSIAQLAPVSEQLRERDSAEARAECRRELRTERSEESATGHVEEVFLESVGGRCADLWL
jgi:DNA-binding IclR family transcriptional regulator